MYKKLYSVLFGCFYSLGLLSSQADQTTNIISLFYNVFLTETQTSRQLISQTREFLQLHMDEMNWQMQAMRAEIGELRKEIEQTKQDGYEIANRNQEFNIENQQKIDMVSAALVISSEQSKILAGELSALRQKCANREEEQQRYDRHLYESQQSLQRDLASLTLDIAALEKKMDQQQKKIKKSKKYDLTRTKKRLNQSTTQPPTPQERILELPSDQTLTQSNYKDLKS